MPGSESTARFVSEDGVIVGEERPADGTSTSLFAVTPTGQRIEIGTLGLDMFVNLMNSHGAVIGNYVKDDDSFGSFYWSLETGLLEIGPVGNVEVLANAMSENDIVVGFTQSEAGAIGFKWTIEGGFVTIPSLGGDRMFPTGVNSSGLVVGFAATANNRDRAFAWTEGGRLIDLGALNGGKNSYAQFVTEDGTVFGSSDARGKETQAFVWTPQSGMRELPSLGGPYSAVISGNAGGTVVGVSSFKGVKGRVDERAVLWTPKTAPPALSEAPASGR